MSVGNACWHDGQRHHPPWLNLSEAVVWLEANVFIRFPVLPWNVLSRGSGGGEGEGERGG